MTIDPRTSDEVFDDVQSNLEGEIDALTNFLDGSFNSVFISAYSDELSEAEIEALVAQLSGWPEYAGKQDFTEDDLDALGIDGIDPDELNDRMRDEQLDELAEFVGVDRDQGSKATGTVTIETATDDTRVREGLEVATTPDADGSFRSFFVDADGDGEIGDTGYVTPSTGTTSVTVDIIAAEVGTEYNVSPGTITRLPNPDVGIEGISANSTTSGGEGVQTNESLRSEIQNAVFESSGGGTAAGVRGAMLDVDGVVDAAVEEFVDQQPPYVDVIVDGGIDGDVESEIDDAKPVGIRHDLVRPRTVNLGITTDLIGLDIDQSFVGSQVSSLLNELSLNDDFNRSRLIQRIMNSDEDVDEIGALSIFVLLVENERHTYQSGTDIYELGQTPLGESENDQVLYDSDISTYELSFDKIDASSVTVEAIVQNDEVELTQGTDYTVVDDDGDGDNDAIDFSVGGQDPDNRTTVTVSYEHSSWNIDGTIEDENGTTYDRSTDWVLVDDDGDGLSDSVDWSVGGSAPSDGDEWFVRYTPKRVLARGLNIGVRSKISAGSTISIDTFDPLPTN